MKNTTDPRPTLDDHDLFAVDLERLLVTKLLVAASSGGGKSYLLRRLCEVTHGTTQHIIFDPEGEFHTLRERHDYILAGPDGDCPATVESAALLATRLLEMGTSAIIDLSELGAARARYVKLFLESMMTARRELWHPVMVVLDEAHKFAPERGAGEAESTEAVKDLATRGRKRGFCLIAATQRLAEIHKTVIAECQNKLIGRTTLDLDIDRARRILGMSAKDAGSVLPTLRDGEFFAYGAAISAATVKQIKTGSVNTTHPRAGQRALPPTPPRAQVKKVLAQLADIPKEAQAEARTLEEYKAQVSKLRTELSQRELATGYNLRSEADNEELRLMREEHDRLHTEIENTKLFSQVQCDQLDALVNEIDIVIERLTSVRNAVPDALQAAVEVEETEARVQQARQDVRQNVAPARAGGNGELGAMARAFLTSLAQHPAGLTREVVLLNARYAAGGGPNKTFAELGRRGLTDATGKLLRITAAGLAALGPFTPLPKGRALRDHVLADVDAMGRKFLTAIFAAYPKPISRQDVLFLTGYAAGGGPNAAFSYLARRKYILLAGKGTVIASKEFYS